jgi:hypothetical protein
MLNRYKIISLHDTGLDHETLDLILNCLFEQNDHLKCVNVNGMTAFREINKDGSHAMIGDMIRYYTWKMKKDPKSKLEIVK